MPAFRQLVGEVFRRDRLPWASLAVAVLATVATAFPETWIYERSAIEAGAWWRLPGGNLVHYGWIHWFFDVGLFVILGRLLEWRHPALVRGSLVLLMLLVAGGVFFFDPGMERYAGMSGVNAGWLVFGVLQGWQRRWTDWFWPAVLVLYVAELMGERLFGQGMVQFDEPAVRIATVAHLAGAAGGVLMWWIQRRRVVRAAEARPNLHRARAQGCQRQRGRIPRAESGQGGSRLGPKK